MRNLLDYLLFIKAVLSYHCDVTRGTNRNDSIFMQIIIQSFQTAVPQNFVLSECTISLL